MDISNNTINLEMNITNVLEEKVNLTWFEDFLELTTAWDTFASLWIVLFIVLLLTIIIASFAYCVVIRAETWLSNLNLALASANGNLAGPTLQGIPPECISHDTNDEEDCL